MAFVQRVQERLRPAAVILFGSLAKGTYYVHSDADVCVILDEPWVDWHGGYERVAPCDEAGTVQPMVYGRDQFGAMVREINALALEICHDGWVLAGDATYVKQLEASVEQVQRAYGLERTSGGWQIQIHEPGEQSRQTPRSNEAGFNGSAQ